MLNGNSMYFYVFWELIYFYVICNYVIWETTIFPGGMDPLIVDVDGSGKGSKATRKRKETSISRASNSKRSRVDCPNICSTLHLCCSVKQSNTCSSKKSVDAVHLTPSEHCCQDCVSDLSQRCAFSVLWLIEISFCLFAFFSDLLAKRTKIGVKSGFTTEQNFLPQCLIIWLIVVLLTGWNVSSVGNGDVYQMM